MNPTLTLLETLDDAHDFLRWLGKRRAWLAVDTETIGLEWWLPNFTRMVQIGDAEKGWAIPLTWWGRVVKDALEAYDGPIVFHNAKFDLHALNNAGIALPRQRIHDTSVMAWLLDPTQSIALKTLAKKFVDESSALGQGILAKGMRKNGWTWATVPVDYDPYWTYGALDTVLTARLAEELYPQLGPAGLLPAYEQEIAVMQILAAAETRGIRLDLDYTRSLKTQWVEEMAKHVAFLQVEGVENPNSAVQIAAALRDQGWEPNEWTPTGEPKLSESVLKNLSSDVARSVLEYRRLNKWSSTYLDAFIERADGDRLHADIRTLRALTGRMSIVNPALQTLPRGEIIRDCVIPDDGHSLFSVDYANIELRLLAHFSQDAVMMDAFRSGSDLHNDTAARLYGPNFTPQQRSICKNGNFAKVYGAGPAKFAQTAKVSEEEARAFMTAHEQLYPGVAAFIRNVENIGRQRVASEGIGYVRTPTGRMLRSEPNKLYTLVNYLCQGTAAEVLKKAILDLDAAGLADGLLLPVHDELIFDLSPEDWDQAVPEICRTMEDHDNFSVPLTVDGSGPLDRWGTKYRKAPE